MRDIRSLFVVTLLTLIQGLFSCELPAQTGGILVEDQQVESSILDKEVSYTIYFPQDYLESNRSYPVLYLLHGFTDDHTAWAQFGEVKAIADRGEDELEITSMIIVMPDAGYSWYVNNHDGTLRYEDFFLEELIPHIDERYRTRPDREFRAIAGLSMGGYGALLYGLRHPDTFSSVAALSAAVYTEEQIVGMEQRRWDYFLGTPFGEARTGSERLTDHYLSHSVLDLVRGADPEDLSQIGIWLDCGDSDRLIHGNMELHALLQELDIENEFRIRGGGHTWDYWRSGLPDALRFVSSRFQR